MKTLFVVETIQPVVAAPAVRVLSFARQFRSPAAQILGGTLVTDAKPGPNLFLEARPETNQGLAFALGWLMFVRRMRRRLIQLARGKDLDAIIISVPQFELLACAGAARQHCRVFVVDIRDSLAFIDYEKHLCRFLPLFLAKRLAVVLRLASKRRLSKSLDIADLITVANEGIASELKKWSNKTSVIANGVDTLRFRPSAIRNREPVAPIELIYIGNFAEKDRFDWLLETLPELRNVARINLIGDGRERASLIENLKLRSISFRDFGRMAHEKVPEILRDMDAGVLLRDSYAEASIPVAFYEFAAMNLPTISNEVGIGADFVRKYRLGYVVASAVELGQLIRRLFEDKSELDKFRSLHELANREFSRHAQSQKLAKCLQQAIDVSKRSSVEV